jgi:four helix bundle suffix protein
MRQTKGENIMTSRLFDKHGGYRKLHSFTFATMIHLETISFCKRFIPWQKDSLGKTAGQMIGAARSGRQNIIEGSERSATSKETEIKLTDVARASLAELLGDYEIFLAENNSIPWSRHSEQSRKFAALRLPEYRNSDDGLHEYWKYYHSLKPAFAPWFESEDPVVVANAMLILIMKTMAMLSSQIRKQGDAFMEGGGFREKMYQARSEVREEKTPVDPDAPPCPECSQPMRKRHSDRGDFWGCSQYPKCKGTRSC